MDYLNLTDAELETIYREQGHVAWVDAWQARGDARRAAARAEAEAKAPTVEAPRARFVSQTAMDDMRGESANDDRERMIDTIMECEGVDRREAERLYSEEFA
ncbi:hypothetical protein BLA17378_03747 [Burkholderia aenigmatica]|uniref:Uncharacterized protein n=1 Tax=Burkholderia aenigmatica TaxID=2015348 RepID=A0ABY6XTM2_9BURK|nr:hypothetical protein [Burkholderia aenigmatica]VWC78514.1 hypothetical protein BLA17378_03747 [Burkholderia aenigmatica]